MRSRTRVLLITALLLIAAPAGAAPLKRFVIIGDSIQSGTGVADATRIASNQLSRLANVIVHNFASPGARVIVPTLWGAPLPLPGMTNAGPHIVHLAGFTGMQGIILIIGTNDWGADFAAFLDAYGHLLDTLPAGVPVVCVTPTWRQYEDQPQLVGQTHTLDVYRYLIYVACVSRGKPWLDGKIAIPNDLQHFPDGLHPNDVGHDALASYLRTSLTQMGWLP